MRLELIPLKCYYSVGLFDPGCGPAEERLTHGCLSRIFNSITLFFQCAEKVGNQNKLTLISFFCL